MLRERKRKREREREREKEKETDRQRDSQRQRQTDRGRQRVCQSGEVPGRLLRLLPLYCCCKTEQTLESTISAHSRVNITILASLSIWKLKDCS